MAYRVTKIRRNLNQSSLSDSSSEEGEKQSDRIVGLVEEHEVAPEVAEAVAAVQAKRGRQHTVKIHRPKPEKSKSRKAEKLDPFPKSRKVEK